MSHITTTKSAIDFTNEQWIKDAIALMGTEFTGIRYEQKTPDLIQVRGYKPIEVYQTKGNLRFIKNEDRSWSMQLDTWNCDDEIAKVQKSFEMNYQRAGINSWAKSRRYTQSSQKTDQGIRVMAQRW